MATYLRCLNQEGEVILVNGKTVRKDMDGNWIAEEELSITEAKAFDAFRETVEKHAGLGISAAEYTLNH